MLALCTFNTMLAAISTSRRRSFAGVYIYKTLKRRPVS